jgi:aldose 1-epimerase
MDKVKTPCVTSAPFGKTKDGRPVTQYTLNGAGGMVLKVIDYGGIVTNILMPDRNGNVADVTPGFADIAGYEDIEPYFSALIGRVGNRIAKGEFTLNGKKYSLPINNTPGGVGCSLHGGTKGFNAYIWKVKPLKQGKQVGLRLSMTSPDGDQGFPGTLKVEVTYWLTADNVWRIEYKATTDKDTPVNMTQHTFFNLKGEAQGDILDHELTIFADAITPVDKGLIPTGELLPVAGTPFDFTVPHLIGERVGAKHEQLKFGGGYDHNWVLRGKTGELHPAATLYEKTTGRCVDVWTTEPGMQFYGGNFLTDKEPGKKPGEHLCFRGALALETQHAPDSPNQPKFPSVILHPGETYDTVTEFRFSTK